MAGASAATPEQAEFRARLLSSGLLIDTGVPGLYGRGAIFEQIREGIAALVTEAVADETPEQMRFPPLLPRHDLEAIGYLRSFPHLAGTVFAFDGDEEQADEQLELASNHEDWSGHQRMTDVVLTPAACYPVYPAVASRGALAESGLTVDAGAAYVYRHEPSEDPARLQMFHQREIVRIDEPGSVQQWRDRWKTRAVSLLSSLGLEPRLEVASDPFFGRSGRMLASSQRQQELKFEVVVPIAGPQPTAVASFNYHQEHFASTYSLAFADGREAHTACLGFGLERITLALLAAHGFAPDSWPETVRGRLWTR